MRSFKKAVSIIMAASLTAGVLAVPYTDKAAAIEQTAVPTTSPVATEAASMLPATSPVSSPVATATAQPTVTPGVQQIAVPVRTIPPQLVRRTAKPAATPKAKKVYGDKLKLNDEIKLNQTKTYVKKAEYGTMWSGNSNKWKKGKVKYTVSCKRKSVGNKYKVTYHVKYKFLSNPKIIPKKVPEESWYALTTVPQETWTVFNYRNGKCLEKKNNIGVKVKGSKWKTKYYPKQHFTPTGALVKWVKKKNPTSWQKILANKKEWFFRNKKSTEVSFTVTYPKDCKDVVVSVGYACYSNSIVMNDMNKDYWNGKVGFDDSLVGSAFQVDGTASYMRLDQ